MDIDKFTYLSNTYGPYASWAVWDEINTRNTAIIEQSLSELNSRYVFIALNISKGLQEHWSNFHFGKHDRKLIKAFNRSSLRGSYMTDLLKNVVEPDSGKLISLFKNSEFLKPHIDFFDKEMQDIGANADATFILLGGMVAKAFPNFVPEHYKTNKRIQLIHYSDYSRTDDAWVSDSLSRIENA